ncbi:MAG: hypothetical protein ACE5JI_10315, partial [Acidobacteriota bacterium]
GLDAAALERLQRETEDIYAPTGVEIAWLSKSVVPEPPHLARVYLMRQIPEGLRRRWHLFGGGDPMAVAFGRSDAGSGPVIYISRSTVAKKATGGAAKEPPAEHLARAVGRVLAHELAHRFLAARHTRRGILKADFYRSDLVGKSAPELYFTTEQAKKLQRVALRATAPIPPSLVITRVEAPLETRPVDRHGGAKR